MIKRIPLAVLQIALVSTLKTCQTTPVLNKVSKSDTMPYIKVGAFTCKPGGSKDTDITDVTNQIHIFSDYDGELETNEIANDVIHVIGVVQLDLTADNFNVMSQKYDMFESFEDEYGYHGVVTFVAQIQNVQQEP